MREKERLFISGCLLGLCCRFDGRSKPLPAPLLNRLQEKFQLVPACPEQLGGLASPREPSEKCGDRFRSQSGKDVTAQYQKGAREALKLAQFFGCQKALMKEKSPSCGFGQIYDGTFTGTLVPGNGAAAELLSQQGITVYGESRIEELLATP
ncbi:MAG: DUF523 domain-containing protein [Clostridia bacterium]|nr:DUF523 domain-containing protein [Clostridia bacterium]